MSILLSAPPACLTSSAATFSARSMLVRNIARYFSEPALRFKLSSINEQVPEIICKMLLSSLAALAIESGGRVGDPASVSELMSGRDGSTVGKHILLICRHFHLILLGADEV